MTTDNASAIVARAIALGRARKLARRARQTLAYSKGPAPFSRLIWGACNRAMLFSVLDEIDLAYPQEA